MLCREICGPTIRARWAMALELDPDDPNRPPRPLALAPEGINAAQDLHLSRTTIRAMRDAAAPVLASNFSAVGDAVEMSVVADAPATAAVACPLGDAASGHRLVYANLPPAMGSIEWLALIALAAKQYEQAEASWQAREAAQARAAVERDMDNARRIQESILPPPFASDGLEVAWHFDPCDAVGGDLVDVFRLPDGRVLLTVADVTGHGLPAALTTLSVHSILHTCARTRLPLADLAATLNEYLEAHLPDGRFVTMALIAMDPATGALEYINAGHPLPLVRRADGSARGLSPAGSLPLGILPGPYAPAHDTLEPGEVMLLVSDGLTELRIADGSMLGPAGVDAMLTEALSRNGESLEQAAAALKRALDDCRLDQAMLDDETFLLVRRS